MRVWNMRAGAVGRTAAFLVAALFALSPPVPGPASAEAAADTPGGGGAGEFRCPAPGTVLFSSSRPERPIRALGQEGMICRFDGFERFSGFWRPDEAIVEASAADLAALWPLKVGNSVTTRYDGLGASGRPGSWRTTTEVSGIEAVTVPAGTFATYVVTKTHAAMGKILGNLDLNRFRSVSTYWWSPQLGYLVKYAYETSEVYPKDRPTDWELVRVVDAAQRFACETGMPEDVSRPVPDAGLSPEQAQLVGLWGDGMWDGILCGQLAIQGFDAEGNARAVYAWGDYPPYNIDRGSARYTFRSEGDRLHFKNDRIELVFTVDGVQLLGQYRRAGSSFISHVILTRQ